MSSHVAVGYGDARLLVTTEVVQTDVCVFTQVVGVVFGHVVFVLLFVATEVKMVV